MTIVVLYHAEHVIPGGFIGVDAFFVISGYVIGAALHREWIANGSIDLRGFYLRRARRLLPAFAAMVTTVVALGVVLSPVAGQRLLARTGIAASLFNANTYLAFQEDGYFEPTIELNALLHTWSLSVEEQFYFVVPAILLLGWRGGRRLGAGRADLPVAAITVGLAVASGALMLWLTYLSGLGSSWAFYLAPARAWEFLAGVLLALTAQSVRRLPGWFGLPAAAAGLIGLAFGCVAFDSATVFPGLATLVPVAATVLLIAAGECAPQNPISRLLGWRPAATLGDLSYGWYLWHWPAIVFAAALWPSSDAVPILAAIASLAIAAASYRWLEQPIRARANPAVRPTVGLVVGTVVIGVIASMGLAVAADRLADRPEVTALGRHFADATGCDDGVPLDSIDGACRVGDGPLDVVVIGDSQAIQLAEAVTLGLGPSATITTAGMNACPFVDLVADRSPGTGHLERCRRFVEDSHASMVRDAPDLVVVSSAASMWVDGSHGLRTANGQVLTGVAERAAAWGDGLERLIEPLIEAGTEVVIVHQAPNLGTWFPSECAVLRLLAAPAGCAASATRAEAEQHRAAAHAAEVAVAERLDLRTIDPLEVLCTDICSAWAGEWLMRDGTHVSVAGGRAMAPSFAALLQSDGLGVLRVVDAAP